MVRVLIVEDNKADVKIIKKALEIFPVTLHVEIDGESALNYLQKEKPNLIILDLNLLKISGREILTFIKSSSELKNIPVIIYTTSRNKEDIKFSYTQGANAYVSKPFNLQNAKDFLNALGQFWIGFVEYDN